MAIARGLLYASYSRFRCADLCPILAVLYRMSHKIVCSLGVQSTYILCSVQCRVFSVQVQCVAYRIQCVVCRVRCVECSA